LCCKKCSYLVSGPPRALRQVNLQENIQRVKKRLRDIICTLQVFCKEQQFPIHEFPDSLQVGTLKTLEQVFGTTVVRRCMIQQ